MPKNIVAIVWTLGTVLFLASSETAVFAQAVGPIPGWYDADVGAVGQPGGSSESDDTFRVSGAGSDIWGTADSFHFTYTPIGGDADLAIKVTSETAANAFAKAGVMLRQSLDPSSAAIVFDVRPDGSTELMVRQATGSSMSFVTGSAGTLPVWLHLARIGEYVAAFTSSQSCSMGCGDWTMVGNGWMRWSAGPALVGLAVTSHDPSTVNDAVLDFFEGTALPAPWHQTDVFAAASPLYFASSGSVAFGGTPGAFAVPSAGSDIWGTADSFTYVWQPVLPGDATLVARVTSNDFPNAYAKAGVMMRESADPGAASVTLDAKPGGGIEFMARPVDGAETAFISGTSFAFPVWLRLVKTADQFAAYVSSDGSSWTAIGATTVSFAANAGGFDAGLAVTAHDPATPPSEFAAFDNVSVSASPTNLLSDPGFEGYAPPQLGAPGWLSDPYRQIAAVSETLEPHGGRNDGACRSAGDQDCGIYQDVVAPATGNYLVAFYANADRPGALVGANVNGTGVGYANVEVRGAGNYGAPYSFGFAANAGDTIRVWMYSPATPGSAVIDDVVLAPYNGPR